MRTPWAIVAVMILLSSVARAQQPDSTGEQKPAAEPEPSKIFYGGTIGFTFGDYFRISVQPMVGYTFTPQISGGLKAAYEYIKDTRYSETLTSHNFGGSVFGRYRFIPQAYAHIEFAAMSYQYKTSAYESDRQWVPFILVGGGYVQRISSSTGLFVEVLFDVLQDSKSPYEDWAPLISVGVMVGF